MNEQSREDAADWLVELHGGSASDHTRQRFADWLRASPEHVRAYLSVKEIWDAAAAYDPERRVDVDALLTEVFDSTRPALLRGKFRFRREGSITPRQLLASPGVRRGVALSVLTLALATCGFFLSHPYVSYATSVGEQRMLTLEDGSLVELNAASRIRVHFAPRERDVVLVEGEALFNVATAPPSPFVVTTGSARVRAVGTAFDVNRHSAETVVTVLEGQVAVSPTETSLPSVGSPEESADAVQVTAGQQIALSKRAPLRRTPPNLSAVTAWTQQQLIFDKTPLLDVAEQFNRFNAQKLEMTDPAAGGIKISGNFPALDPLSLPRFVRFLREQPGLQVEETPEKILVAQK